MTNVMAAIPFWFHLTRRQFAAMTGCTRTERS